MPTENSLIMYGCPPSLYTGKVRSYLRKAGLPYEERLQSHPDYLSKIMPKIGRFVIPVIETDTGHIVQDTSEIIDYLETNSASPFGVYPQGPKQKIVSLFFELFGDEGLLRPAMHYRWNFPDQNADFIAMEFGRMAKPDANREEALKVGNAGMQKMQAYLPGLGITEETIPDIEATYEELLRLLDAHFLASPYLLGGRPTIGDFGLYAPLYAHLARDPAPSLLMKHTAQRVWRWVERMTASDADMPDFPGHSHALAEDDQIPDTLLPVMQHLSRTFVPEMNGLVDFFNRYLTENPDIEPGTPVITDKNARVLGGFSLTIGDQQYSVAARHFSIWMLQRLQDAYDQLDKNDAKQVDNLFEKTGLSGLITMRCNRRIERENFKEVWR